MAWSKTSRHVRGYGTAWDKLRLRVLRRDKYICQVCLREGRYTAATAVDHIVAKARGGNNGEANCQAICARCHDEKTAAESRLRITKLPQVGADGWTIK